MSTTAQLQTEEFDKKFAICNITKTFKENVPSNYAFYTTIKETFKDVLNKETASFEILRREVRRLYLDLENIPKDRPDVVDIIVKGIKELLNIPNVKHHVSFNKASKTHAGLSYHVVFNICMTRANIYQAILYYKSTHEDYSAYIDPSVYSRIRLFRLPFNGKPIGSTIDNNDFHDIITEGSILDDFYIQDTDSYPMLEDKDIKDEIKSFDARAYLKERRAQHVDGDPKDSNDNLRYQNIANYVMDTTEKMQGDINDVKAEIINTKEENSKKINELTQKVDDMTKEMKSTVDAMTKEMKSSAETVQNVLMNIQKLIYGSRAEDEIKKENEDNGELSKRIEEIEKQIKDQK